jgi:penicillin amidase
LIPMGTPKSPFLAAGFSALLRPFIRRLALRSLPKYTGSLTIPGLENEVDILWDTYGVPHVSAAHEHDLFLAQGYLHAQERLWQMDLNRCFLSGRMAEIFGRFAVPWKEVSSHFRGKDSTDFDYFIRLIGIRESALRSWKRMPEVDRRRLQAYSDGVNRYIEHCGKRLPWEFRLLRYQPEPWRPEDSLTTGKGFAFLLSPALFTRLNMIAVTARLSTEQDKLRSLWPGYPEDAPAITEATWDAAAGLWNFMSGTFAASDWNPAGQGSNSWVVGPDRSATGHALLSNDPHLRLTLPSMWYFMHLKADAAPTEPDGYEVWGASIPGCPCIQIGHNRWIAWGITAALCDDVELYREKVEPLEPNRYLAGDRWLTMETRLETIRIRGKGEIQKTVRSTRHGPVVSDFHSSNAASEVLAFRWTAHEPSQEFRCLYGTNRARNWQEFLAALAFQCAPNLSYVYADRQGNIGYSLAGSIPVRPAAPSLLPLEGWRPENDWHGYIPFAELPRLYNPREGIIATANHRISGVSYNRFVSHFFEPPYRVSRIKELLRGKKSLTVEDLAAIQADVVSLHAKELIEDLKTDIRKAADDHGELSEAVNLLLLWDGSCDPESTEAAIFHVFHYRLMANLLVPVLGEELFVGYIEIFNQCLAPIHGILKDEASPWFAGTSRQALVTKSLIETRAELADLFGPGINQWRWGRLHALTLDHALSRIAFLRSVLSIGPVPTAGDNVTVNMGFYRQSNPYRHTVGASMRMIIELDNPTQLQAILLPGQSGHLFSPHYSDQADLWHHGRYISFSEAAQERSTERKLKFMPAK